MGDGLEKKADYSENHPFSRFRNKVKQTMNVVAASTCSKIVNEKLNDRSLIESMPWFKDVKSELVDVEKIKTVTSLTANSKLIDWGISLNSLEAIWAFV